MNTATEYGHYKSGVANSYSSREFANELKEILPKSPKAFTYMLKLAFQNTFPFTEDEIHSVIDDIAVSIPTTKLQELLGDTDAAETVNITKPPLIATELHSYLDVHGIGIAMLLARHKYGDLSETDRNRGLTLSGTKTHVKQYFLPPRPLLRGRLRIRKIKHAKA